MEDIIYLKMEEAETKYCWKVKTFQEKVVIL